MRKNSKTPVIFTINHPPHHKYFFSPHIHTNALYITNLFIFQHNENSHNNSNEKIWCFFTTPSTQMRIKNFNFSNVTKDLANTKRYQPCTTQPPTQPLSPPTTPRSHHTNTRVQNSVLPFNKAKYFTTVPTPKIHVKSKFCNFYRSRSKNWVFDLWRTSM